MILIEILQEIHFDFYSFKSGNLRNRFIDIFKSYFLLFNLVSGFGYYVEYWELPFHYQVRACNIVYLRFKKLYHPQK